MALRSTAVFIGRSVSTGMIIQFNYQKDSGERQYTVLVVDPDRTNPHAQSPQLHAYDISKMDDREFVRFLCELDVPFEINPAEGKLALAQLDSLAVYEAFKASAKRQDRPYRTFTRSKITNIRQVKIGVSQELGITKDLPLIVISDDISKRKLLERLEQGLPINDVPEIKEAVAKKSTRSRSVLKTTDQTLPLQDILGRE